MLLYFETIIENTSDYFWLYFWPLYGEREMRKTIVKLVRETLRSILPCISTTKHTHALVAIRGKAI